jgi:ATP-dependent RNA helicase MSS116
LQLILDEADTMLDMGFDRDLQAILRTLPPSRQTFLFSATVSPAIQNIATTFLKPNSLFLDVVPKGEAQTVDRIDQHATVLPSANQMLPHILRVVAHDQLIRPKSKTILFCNTTKMTQLMATIVRNMTSYLPAGQNTRVYEIHSKMEQRDRSRTSDRFRQEKSESSILVTSDVSARGVDYPGTSRVIQFGISGDGEQYTHRVGRTGRGGAEGRGDIVLCPFEAGFLDTELRKFPIKSLSVNELRSEVADLAGKRGQDVAEKLNQLEQGVAEIQSRLSPDVLGEVFGSMLGYYAKMDKVLAIRKDDIPGGIIQLGAQGFGMNPPPSFSQGFLAKVGFGGSGGGGSRSRGFAGQSRSPFLLFRSLAFGEFSTVC